MLRTTRISMLAVLAVVIVSAVAAASASATPQYKISGKTFTGSETVTAKALTPGTLESKLPGGAKIKIVCKSLQSKGGELSANNKGKATALEFYLCEVTEPAGCKVASPISTVAVSTTALDVGTGVNLQFVPTAETEGKKLFTTIKITGCSAEGAFKVIGSAECIGVAPTVEAVLKSCEFTTGSGSSLTFGTEPATLLGTAGFELTGTNKGLVFNVQP